MEAGRTGAIAEDSRREIARLLDCAARNAALAMGQMS
jgi:hypothetical protein